MGRKNRKQKVTATSVNGSAERMMLSSVVRESTEICKHLYEKCTVAFGSKDKSEWEDYLEVYEIIQQLRLVQSKYTIPTWNREEHMVSFLQWLEKNDVNTKSIGIRQFEGEGFGLMATRDIKVSELLLEVPRQVMMSTDTAVADPALGPLITADRVLQNMPNVVLALHLLCEVHNPESQWAPYLKILPSEYTIPLYFTPDDVKQLKGSPVYSEAINQLRNIARQYTYFFKLFQIYENAGSIPIRHFCFDDYRWAAATVMTRQNQIPSEDGSRRITALIPLWDMCNHKNGELTTDFSLEKQCCQCFAMENLIQGDQVYIFYGNRPNAEFLVHNGFVYHRNQHDKVAVKMGISKNDPLYNSKMDVMAKVALPASRSYYLHTGSDPVDSELLMFSRIHCMTQEELDFCLSDTFKRSRLRDFDTLVSLENEKKAWEFLYTRTQLLYKVYVYSKGIDEPHTAHEALIRDEVATERRILNTASQYCHHQAQQVGKQMQDKTLLMKDGVPLENGSVSDGPDRGFHGLVADMPQVPRSALAADEAQLAKEIDEIELNF